MLPIKKRLLVDGRDKTGPDKTGCKSAPGLDQIMIFSTPSNMKFLEKCDARVAEGVFEVTAEVWHKVCAIDANIVSHVPDRLVPDRRRHALDKQKGAFY